MLDEQLDIVFTIYHSFHKIGTVNFKPHKPYWTLAYGLESYGHQFESFA